MAEETGSEHDDEGFWALDMEALERDRQKIRQAFGDALGLTECIEVKIGRNGTMRGRPAVTFTESDPDVSSPDDPRIVVVFNHGVRKQFVIDSLVRLALTVQYHWEDITSKHGGRFGVRPDLPQTAPNPAGAGGGSDKPDGRQ